MGAVTADRIRRVLVAHNPVGAADDPSTSDVLAQVAQVESALAELGIPFVRAAAGDSSAVDALRGAVRSVPGTVVFNLIEAPPGLSQLSLRSAAALELGGVPLTGSPSSALWLTTDKLATRALLASEGLPVAPGGRLDPACPAVLDRVAPPWILKPACEDASVGLEGNPVCATREEALARAARLAARFPGQPVLAERYLPGRELNVSLLADGEDVEVLPVAEILFQDFPAEMSRVVGYEAKWLEDSFAYTHTVRSFLADPADAPLIETVRRLARHAWTVCGLAGYARVDLRLDESGEPFILEINANPCLAANAGFMAAAGRAGLTPGRVVERILAAVPTRCPAPASEPSAQPARPAHPEVTVRRGLEPADREPVAELIRATGFFNPEEIEVALELVDDRLAYGEASHYRFLVGEVDARVAGYACWGPIAGTQAAADLYWIAVHPREQGKGVGAALLTAAEDWMAAAGRHRVYVETSTRVQYVPTRSFYLACGYVLTAELADFYAPGDGKAIFLKVL
jgi:D-alanine-D-alanine ligase-like ATP-grasp enzyme/GNAT superfamily N-acetyltransferase